MNLFFKVQKPIILSLIIFTFMATLSACENKSENENTDPIQGKYQFATRFQKPSATDASIIEKGQIFDGTLELNNGTFFISGTDTQQFPWRDKPQNHHEEEKGTYQIKGDTITFRSPDLKEGGWSFSGEFKFFIYKTEEGVMKMIYKKNIQYHLLQKKDEYVVLMNPYYVEKESL